MSALPRPPAIEPTRYPARVALATGLLFLLWFQLDTVAVRFANIDDVTFHQVTQKGSILSYIEEMAACESRFFLWWNLGLIELFNQITSLFWFSLHRTLLLAWQFALGGWLLARLCGNARYGWLFWVIGLGTLQIPPGFYPLLSYPPISFGFVAFLTAALAYDYALTENRPALLIGAALCYLTSLLLHDTFAIFAPLFAFILKARRGAAFRGSLPTLWPIAIVLALYTAVYLGYRAVTGTQHTYDGTTPSFLIWPALITWTRYTFSTTPGFELWFLREGDLGSPAFRSAQSALEIIRDGASLRTFAKAALVTVSVGLLLRQPHRSLTGRGTLRLVACLAVPAFLACVPVALSAKYQIWAIQRQMPYAYSFFACFFGWAAFSALLISGGGSHPRRRYTAINTFALTVVFYATFCAQITNPRVLRFLHERYNSPSSIAAAIQPPP